MTKAKKKSSGAWRIVAHLWAILISWASHFLSYLLIIYWICAFGKKSKPISISLRLLEGQSRIQKAFCHIVDAQSGFVWMDGIGNVDNSHADIWYSLGWTSKQVMFLGKCITKKHKIRKVNGSLFISLLRRACWAVHVWQTLSVHWRPSEQWVRGGLEQAASGIDTDGDKSASWGALLCQAMPLWSIQDQKGAGVVGDHLGACTTVAVYGLVRNNNLIFWNLCFRKLVTLMYSGSEQDRQGPFLMGLSFLGVTPMASEGLSPGRALRFLQSQRPSSSSPQPGALMVPNSIVPTPTLGKHSYP